MYAEYNGVYYTASGTVTAKGLVVSIDYKKIKFYELKNIWGIINVYLFWLLPDWTWRDGNS